MCVSELGYLAGLHSVPHCVLPAESIPKMDSNTSRTRDTQGVRLGGGIYMHMYKSCDMYIHVYGYTN